MASDTTCACTEDVQGVASESDSQALPDLLVIATAVMAMAQWHCTKSSSFDSD